MEREMLLAWRIGRGLIWNNTQVYQAPLVERAVRERVVRAYTQCRSVVDDWGRARVEGRMRKPWTSGRSIRLLREEYIAVAHMCSTVVPMWQRQVNTLLNIHQPCLTNSFLYQYVVESCRAESSSFTSIPTTTSLLSLHHVGIHFHINSY